MPTPRPSLHTGVILMLALRNLRRNVRRTLLTAAALVIGGMYLTLALLVVDGMIEQWINDGVRTGTGHVTIERPGFRLSQEIDDRLPASARPAVMRALAAPDIAEQVTSVFPRLTINGLASSAAGAQPAQILGVDPETEAALGSITEQVVDGRYLEAGDRLEAYIGSGLAERLDLRIGARLVLSAQDTEKEIAGQLVRVVGIFGTGVAELDESLVHIPLATAGTWLGAGEDVTNIGVVVDDSTDVPRLVRGLRQALADSIARGEAAVIGWQDAMPMLRDAVFIERWGGYLIQAILFVIIGFGVVNTVLMSVLHRHREFGVLHALGLTPRQTAAVVLVEGMALTAVSGIIGVGLGVWICWFFMADGFDLTQISSAYDGLTFSGVAIDPVLYPVFRLSRLVQALGFMVFIGAVASLYPAFRAATIDAAEAMKFDR